MSKSPAISAFTPKTAAQETGDQVMTQQSMLSFVPSQAYERRWERFNIQHSATLLAVMPQLAGLTARPCKMIDISVGGASFSVNTTIGLPLHYYLTFEGSERRIGCAEVYRQDHRIGVKFIKPIDETYLHEIMTLNFETEKNRKKPARPSLHREMRSALSQPVR